MNTLSGFRVIFYQMNGNEIAELIMMILLLVGLNIFLYFFIKRKIVYISSIVGSSLILLAYIFELNTTVYLLCFMMLILLFIGIMANLAEFRVLFANKATQKLNNKVNKGINKKKKGKGVSKIYDHNELYEKLNECVEYCSKNKIGALITIERNDDLSNIMKNGTILNCPVSPELLETIFYPGSRLHDGAVIIKDDMIVAASVYYTPTTKTLSGKYGSRHRAALGISEICDAVTIIVSEETGRISIAFNGELNSYSPDYFLRALINTMNFIVTESSEEAKKND